MKDEDFEAKIERFFSYASKLLIVIILGYLIAGACWVLFGPK